MRYPRTHKHGLYDDLLASGVDYMLPLDCKIPIEASLSTSDIPHHQIATIFIERSQSNG